MSRWTVEMIYENEPEQSKWTTRTVEMKIRKRNEEQSEELNEDRNEVIENDNEVWKLATNWQRIKQEHSIKNPSIKVAF